MFFFLVLEAKTVTAVNCKGDVTRDDLKTTIFTKRNTALQHCSDVVSNCYKIVPTLQPCVALKIVVANRPFKTSFIRESSVICNALWE